VGGAVVRTRCKRRLRELRQELQGAPLDIVINARRSSASAPWADLERDFMECARRGLEKVARTQNQSLVARPG
jgi:ribonuclease P protein component